MQNLECKQCGLVYLDSVASCPLCGRKTPNESPSSSRPLLWGALCVLLAVAGGVTYYLWPAPAREPAYVQAIRSSAELKRLATVIVNKYPLGTSGIPPLNVPFSKESAVAAQRGVTRAAYVLAARGLLAFDVTLNEHRTPSTLGAPTLWVDANGRPQMGAKPPDLVTWSKSLAIRVTDMGRKDAAEWEETEEPFDGATRKVWRVPVGEVEFVKIGKVTTAQAAGGMQKVTAEIVWRWRPNWVGLSFDQSSEVFKLLPDKARAAASGLGFNSRQELNALVELESAADGWRVLDIHRLDGSPLNEVLPAD